MKLEQVALTLYTLREFCKTPEDLAQTLKKVRKIGYPAVQISGVGPIPEEEIVKMLDGEGLVCCATHEKSQIILENPEAVVERLNKLNCKYTAFPNPDKADIENIDTVKALAAKLNASGKVIFEGGKVLTYHNHYGEFKRADNTTFMDIIYSHTDSRYLQGEIDTYWVQYGGGDVVKWVKKMNGRLPLLHIKDYVINENKEITYTEIGNGNLEWKDIIAAADASGCEWFIVEQDRCPGDPFDSIKQSFDYIKGNLLQ